MRPPVADPSVSEWLDHLLDARIAVHLALDFTFPCRVRIAMKPPERRRCGKIPVEVFYPDQTEDGAGWLWISSELDNALSIVNALEHGLLHLGLGEFIGHTTIEDAREVAHHPPRFLRRARALGLIGRPTDHWPGSHLSQWIVDFTAAYGAFPGARVSPKGSKQAAKRGKVDCPNCGESPHYVSVGMIRRAEQGFCGRGCTNPQGEPLRLEAEAPFQFSLCLHRRPQRRV